MPTWKGYSVSLDTTGVTINSDESVTISEQLKSITMLNTIEANKGVYYFEITESTSAFQRLRITIGSNIYTRSNSNISGEIIGVIIDTNLMKFELRVNNISVMNGNISIGNIISFVNPSSNVIVSFKAEFDITKTVYTPVGAYKLFFVPNKRVLFYNSNAYKKYNALFSTWDIITSSTPTESDYLQGNTSEELSLIPETAWQQLTGTVELCYFTDDATKTETQFNIETEPFTLADEFEGKEVKVLEYTDNPSQAESKVETEVEPYTIYDEFGDTMEVLYYTDDASKTSADLEITANYSPLDEIDEDFEVVTWTNELTEAREEQTSVLNEDIVVDDGKVYETKINLQDVIGIK